jgi:short-subunit dehydrogenase
MSPSMLSNKVALITGASAGIGEAFARKFASNNFDLVLVARSGDKLQRLAQELEETHPIQASTYTCDLRSAAAVDQLAESCADRGIDVLINNAGVMYHGEFKDQEIDSIDNIVQLNIASLTRLSRRILPFMLEQDSGRILNVTSTTGFKAGPTIAVYAASKAYILSFTEALAEELRGTGVSATAFCPGFTDTHMAEESFGAEIKQDPVSAFLMMSVDEVASEGFKACMEGTTISIPGVTNNILNTLSSLQPKWLSRRLQSYMYRNFLDDHGS